MHILIIEDSGDRCAFFRGLYGQQTCLFVDSAEDAIERLEECQVGNQPDLQDDDSTLLDEENAAFDLIHLDHDLEGDGNGADVAEFLELNTITTPVIVHSENPAGVEDIIAHLPHAIVMPFSEFESKSPMMNKAKAMLAMPLHEGMLPIYLEMLRGR
jgi:CheY-like chemotaxis protein